MQLYTYIYTHISMKTAAVIVLVASELCLNHVAVALRTKKVAAHSVLGLPLK